MTDLGAFIRPQATMTTEWGDGVVVEAGTVPFCNGLYATVALIVACKWLNGRALSV